jgi:hypothetical protein
LGGSFRKTASGTLMEIPALVLSTLPEPTENDLSPIPPEKAVTPVANNTSGSYETSVTVTLTSETEGASIYYTTNGVTPTTSSTRYPGPIVITQSCTLSAIAVAEGMENSTVMIENYGIDAVPLQTEWSLWLPEPVPEKIIRDDGRWWTEYINIPAKADVFHNYDPEKLTAEGYSRIQLWGWFEAKEIADGWLRIYMRQGHDGNGPMWFEYWNYDLAADNSGWQQMSIWTTEIAPFSKFGMDFMITWGADGDGADDWQLGRRRLKFTAVK